MEQAQAVLVWVMRGMLKLLHPFMPYITEEIWQVLTNEESMIMLESYPVYTEEHAYAEAAQFEKVIDAIPELPDIHECSAVQEGKRLH